MIIPMAGEEHIRSAVDSLRRLINVRQQEIGDIRQQINQDEQAKRGRIDAINRQVQMVNSQVADSRTDNDMRARLTRQLADMEAEKSHLEQDMAKIRQMHNQQIQDKENHCRNIEHKISELQSL